MPHISPSCRVTPSHFPRLAGAEKLRDFAVSPTEKPHRHLSSHTDEIIVTNP